MTIDNTHLTTITKYLYPAYTSFEYHDNGDQIVVNVTEAEDDFEFYFKYILFKEPIKITINDKRIPSGKLKKIKELIK